MTGIWKRMQRARIFDCELPAFCPEDLLVALCLHTGQHEWVQLSHYCDLAQLLAAHSELDWDIVYSHMGDSNTKRIIHVCLYLLHQHWHARIPHRMMVSISADPHVARLAKRIENEMWPYPESMMLRSEISWLLDRSAGEDLSDRWGLLVGMLFSPTQVDFETFRLPQALVSLYPGMRALRLARKYSTSWLNR
jgi:hypothetical protein